MIKFKLGEYDVKISANNKILKDHEKDTFYLLNQLSIISGLAANVMCDQGYEGLAGCYREFQNDFFRACYENGLYKEVEK